MLRDRASIMAIVCSAVLSVLPAGVFITTMPNRVAARVVDVVGADAGPHDRLSRRLPSSASAVILTPLRQIAPSNSARASRGRPLQAGADLVLDAGALASKSSPSWAKVSRTMTLGMGR